MIDVTISGPLPLATVSYIQEHSAFLARFAVAEFEDLNFVALASERVLFEVLI